MKLDTTTVVQLASFSAGLFTGLLTTYKGVNIVPSQVEMFFYKHFSQSGRYLVEEDKAARKRASYRRESSIHRGVSNDRAPSE